VLLVGRGGAFLAALDRDCGTDSPPAPQLAMAHWPEALPHLSDRLLLSITIHMTLSTTGTITLNYRYR
jgi:hypothetical protein